MEVVASIAPGQHDRQMASAEIVASVSLWTNATALRSQTIRSILFNRSRQILEQ